MWFCIEDQIMIPIMAKVESYEQIIELQIADKYMYKCVLGVLQSTWL